MKTTRTNYVTSRLILAAALALAALIGYGLPGNASAATSGGATIYNTVKVTYSTGAASFFASANVSVTVNTIAAAPTVTNPTGQTVTAGTAVTYNYAVKSNSNGPDTYTTSALANTPTNVAAATGTSVTLSVQLWGGIALGSGAGTITVPFGTTGSLTAGTSKVQIGANQYTVTTITPGSAASTGVSGNLVAEAPTTLTLTPIGAAPVIIAGSVAAGTQVGEFKTAALTAALTAGNPTTAGTDGTYSTSYTITTTATDAVGSAVTYTTIGVTTTVLSPALTISKYARNVTTGAAGIGPISYGVNTYYSSGVSGKPGETLEYLIRVTNTSTTASATSVTVIDAVPAYTAYTASSTLLNGITVAGDGVTSPLSGAGLLVDNNGTRIAGAAASGILPASGVANITFRVQIQ